MPKFSDISANRLKTCHPLIQEVCNEVINRIKCSVSCGHRGQEEQDKAFTEGKSRLKYPMGMHNKIPSLAVDLVPLPLDWDNIESFNELSKVVLDVAKDKNILIQWGGNWKTFRDNPHYELIHLNCGCWGKCDGSCKPKQNPIVDPPTSNNTGIFQIIKNILKI